MAQIIKHRRGQLTGVKNLTARNAEFIIASGSISDLQGPFVFIGSPNSTDEGVAGAFKSVSKIYQGATAPSITAGSYGSILDGTPFYASGNKSLYILNNDGAGGNTRIDLSGNLEGNTISGITINNITGSKATFSTFVSASALNVSGNTQMVGNTTVGGTLGVSGKTTLDSLEVLHNTNLDGNLSVTGAVAFVNENAYQPQNVDIKSEYASQLRFFVSGSQNGTIYSSNPGELVVSANTVKINNLIASGSFSGSFEGDGSKLINIPASGVTGLELNKIVDGSVSASITQAGGFKVNTNTEVSGNLNVTSNITGSNLYLTGDAKIDGNIVLGGNINIGNQTTDLITFGGEVSSSIVPTNNNAFDLGSSTQAWRDIYVSGTAHIDTLSLGSIELNSISLPGDLSVSGTTTLEGDVYVSELTQDRIVLAGTGGALTDSGDLTFDGSTIYVGQGNIELDTDGDIRTSGSLFVTNGTTISGSASVDGHINLTGDAQIRVTDATTNTVYGYFDGSNILGAYYQMFGNDITNAAQRGGAEFVFDSTNGGQGGFNIAEYNGSTWSRKMLVDTNGVNVTGTTTLNGNLIVTGSTQAKGAVGINSSLSVTGSATLKNNLSVSGTTSIDGTTAINNTLTVSGTTTLNNTLTVVNTSEFKDAVGINNNLNVTGSVQVDTDLTVSGDSNLGNTYVSNLTSGYVTLAGADGQLVDSADLTFDGSDLSIGGGNATINIDGTITSVGALNVDSLSTTNNAVVGGVLSVSGNTELQGNLFVSGNLEVLGSATNVSIQSNTIELGDNIIKLNAYSPFERYAGIEVMDSGSTNLSASMLWDSVNDYWMFVSSSGASSKVIGTTYGAYGSETSLTSGTFPIASAGNTIGNSLLTYTGTTLALNTNKFTVDSSSGDTLVSGNFTLSATGGADNGTKTSAIMFRNSDNVVGFVSTTETTDVLDGILGYKHSGGGLTFSTVIDGGTY